MPRASSVITSFGSGEVSRLTESRIELEQYRHACRTLENVFILPMGGAQGRPGTKYVSDAHDNDRISNLFPFIYRTNDAYIISIGRTSTGSPDVYSIWIYKDGVRLEDIGGSGVHALSLSGVITFESDDEVLGLHAVQIDNILYFAPDNLGVAAGVGPLFRLTYTSVTSWAADAVNFVDTGSGDWVTGADYNAAQGTWPSLVAAHEQRLIVGGDQDEPSRVIGSQVNYEYQHGLTSTVVASDPWTYNVKGTRAQGLLSWTGLLYFAYDSEWSFGTSVIAPTSLPLLKRQSQNGSSRIQPVLMQNTGAFVQAGGKVVREILFSNDLQAYTARDLTALAEHVTGRTGLQDMVFQTNPASVLWCLRKDGQIACLNIQEDGSKAWTRIVTNSGDSFESICSLRVGSEEQIWVCVKRVVNGSTKRYIEYFNERDYGTDEEDAVFVDSALIWDGGAAKAITDITKADPGVVTTSTDHNFSTNDYVRIADVEGMTEINGKKVDKFRGVFKITDTGDRTFTLQAGSGHLDTSGAGYTAYTSGGTATKVIKEITNTTTLTAGGGTKAGLSHLQNASLSILADAGVHSAKTVSTGAITLDNYYNTVVMGLGYNQNIEPVPLETAESVGMEKNVERCAIKVYKTQEGVKVGPTEDQLENVIFRKTTDYMSAPVPLFTGMFSQTIEGYTDRLVTVYIRNPNPFPMTVLGIRSSVKLNDI